MNPLSSDGTILFVGADAREFAGIVGHWSGVKPFPTAVHWARTGLWRGRPAIAIANGAGVDRAFAAVVLAGHVGAVCNIGFCGALDPELRIGDIVVATAIEDTGAELPLVDPRGEGPALRGIVATRNRIAATAAEKKAIRDACGAVAVEMEAAGAHRGAGDLGVPFYCVRAVSDLATEDFANDFNAVLQPDGRFSLPRLIAGALKDPSKRFAELMRLRERTTLAANKLGEFLETCRF